MNGFKVPLGKPENIPIQVNNYLSLFLLRVHFSTMNMWFMMLIK